MTYPTQFPTWLTLAANDGRGGLSSQPSTIVRGSTKSFVYNFATHPDFDDWTDGSFSADLKASPDAAGAALASFSITTGIPASGVTPVAFTLLGEDHDNIPADTDGDGVTEVFMQVNYTPDGGSAEAIIQTRVLFTGAI